MDKVGKVTWQLLRNPYLQRIESFGCNYRAHLISPRNANKLLESHKDDVGAYILGGLDVQRVLNKLIIKVVHREFINSRAI
ncbi:hypothetical protein RRF57_000278 [Xylaria bambusicola]|uniref:Uncharacterized protein n=1 Tax=Xylaria bambusicola TaxID=326684 RepID=A0AAN7Z0J3_9PEZI